MHHLEEALQISIVSSAYTHPHSFFLSRSFIPTPTSVPDKLSRANFARLFLNLKITRKALPCYSMKVLGTAIVFAAIREF